MNNYKGSDPNTLEDKLSSEQLHIHYTQLPTIIIAPALGATFSAWVLWDAANQKILTIGMALVIVVSVLRALAYKWYFTANNRDFQSRKWHYLAVGLSLVSGIVWGSAAVFLYPPNNPDYLVFLSVLMALVPLAPIAALAVYMPAFYAYYAPCISPYIAILAMQGGWPEKMTALLLMAMSVVMIKFAVEHNRALRETIRLRLKLLDKTKALERESQIKTNFLAAASHDLRQPAHALGLFIDSLPPHVHDAPGKHMLSNMRIAFQGLQGMLDEMLDISRLDAKLVTANKHHFQLAILLKRLATEYREQAERKGIELRCRAQQVTIYSDPALLERIIRNLLSNAVRYTKNGGILITCRRRKNTALIQVYDTGIGIAKHRQKDIFLEFTQINNPGRTHGQGLGLGLAIAERLARLLGHQITLRSEEGRGSVFSIYVDAPAASFSAGQPLPAPLPMRHDSLHVKSILLIDDDIAICESVSALLGQLGCKVVYASSPEAGLERANKLGVLPELLMLDYRLGDGRTAQDAITILHQALAKPIPTIIITGDTDPQRIKEAHAAGLLLLHKPLSSQRLIACINALAANPGHAEKTTSPSAAP